MFLVFCKTGTNIAKWQNARPAVLYTAGGYCLGKASAQAIAFSDGHCVPPQVDVVHSSKPDWAMCHPFAATGFGKTGYINLIKKAW
jgi:hypothetical protein